MAKGMEELPLKILLLGPPGHGKSTVAVQILCKWGCLGPKSMQTLQKQMEQKNLTHAQLLESLRRGRGRHYDSPKYEVSVIRGSRCPFIPHKSQAACVLLLLSAVQEDFGTNWRLLKKQLDFACKLPVQQLVVCLNKMDAMHLPYSGRIYKNIVYKISARLQGLGRSPDDVVFLPISAMHGDNMESASLQMPWFEGWEIKEAARGTLRGVTLRQLLDGIFLNYKLDSYSKTGVWSPPEEKSLLQVWKAMATPASNNAPCPHHLSLALLCAGVRRSPEQCRSKANSLLNCYIAARLQRWRHPSSSPKELQDILDREAAQAELQWEKLRLRLQGQTQASEPQDGEEPAVSAPPWLQEQFLAGEVLGKENGPGVRSERPEGNLERREGLQALPECLRLPRGQRDQDPDYVLTGLEIKPCRRVAWPMGGLAEPGAAEAAFLEGYRCVVNRSASFAVKKQQAKRAAEAPPQLRRPKPLLEVPPLPPFVAQGPPLPPTVEVDQLVLFPLPPAAPLQLPLLPVDGPELVIPTSTLFPLAVTPVSLCWAPAAPPNALPWQNQQAFLYAPLQPVEPWPSPLSWDPAPEGDEPPPTQLGPPAAAAAPWLTPGSPEPDPLGPPPEESCDLLSAVVDPESPSSGTSVSPLQHEASPQNSLGLSATALLSSLARLESEKDLKVACPPGTPLRPLSPPLSAEKDLKVACPPGTPLRPLSPPLSADSGAPPSPQLQSLLSSSRLPSPSWLDLCPGDS